MSETALTGRRLGFIGAGNMAEALIRGLVVNKVVPPETILASDVLEARRQQIEKAHGIKTTPENLAVVDRSDVVVLAVKPQVLAQVLSEIGPRLGPEKLLISVVAGVAVKTIQAGVAEGTRIIRTIPNTPAMVLAGATGLAAQGVAPADLAVAEAIFGTIGRVVRIEEKLIDAATGLSGSGPAYVFVIIEALADGGVNMGLPRPAALTLAAQTVLGAAKLCLESGLHPGQLKDMVASPGGTTIAGLHALERGGLRAALMNAVEAATRRSESLGKIS